MKWKDLRGDTVTVQRLDSLEEWRDSPFYTERERAPPSHGQRP
jgi:alkylhydroperoxidase family enzyme